MANTQKPLLRIHQFFGEDEAHDLLLWMNTNEYPANKWVTVKDRLPAFRRIFRVLELAKEVENALNKNAPQLVSKIERLNNAVAQFAFRPRFLDPPRFVLTWRPNKPEKVLPSEHGAVLSLLRLLELRSLHRVRPCSNCSIWFFARYKHSKFCKTACQQEHYASSATFRNERRTYMREYRRKYGY
jgi:hypothetical protein